MLAEEQPESSVIRELQQLQAQLQSVQQERDRVAATYAASQQAALAAAQAAEIRQQLSILQAEILSMQPMTQPAPQPGNIATAVNKQPANHSGTIRGTLDLKSPLSEGLEASPWPASYKPIAIPKFNGKADPRQFLMSFEAAVASAGGSETVLAKSFVIAAKGNALAWYSMLRSGSIYSWENLHDKILANFQGFTTESLTSTNLFQCKQSQGKALQDYF